MLGPDFEIPCRVEERRRGRTGPELHRDRAALEREWRLRQSATPLHVLLVDCIPDEQDMYVFGLSSAGYLPVSTCEMKTAMEIAVSTRPHVVVIDAAIHDGAMLLVSRLRQDQRTNHALIVVLSSYVQARDSEAAMRAGCDLFLHKPCLPEALVEALEEALRD